MIDIFRGSYYFLSNFYPCEIEHDSIVYPSLEHYYVALKCDNDQIINGKYYTCFDFRELISKVKSPGKVKIIGKNIKVRSDWNDIKLDIMWIGIQQKFRNKELSELLISTGDQKLVEGNYWHDNFYGQCTCEKCIDKGKNKLGKLLMKIRSELNGTQKKGLEQLF